MDFGGAGSGPGLGHQALLRARELAPPLGGGARPVVRDRWERLVTTVYLPVRPESVWRALTDPEALSLWLARCHGSLEELGSDCTLDFEDGEFFLCRPLEAEPNRRLRYIWRWIGIGQATHVQWDLVPRRGGTEVTVTEEATNAPWDWQTWNGGGWPGILDQLAGYLRTGTSWRWPWRRMGPYAQIELPVPFYAAWDALMNEGAQRFWLQVNKGSFAGGSTVDIVLGDASGMAQLDVIEFVRPGERAPSFLPYVVFTLGRGCWGAKLDGRIWLEPAGLDACVLQVFHQNWESLPAALQLSERRIVASFWAGAWGRALQMFGGAMGPPGPHSW